MLDPMIMLAGGALVVGMTVAGFMMLSCFQRCGPNQAMIISGLGTARGKYPYTIVKGGGAVVLPLIQQRAFISLEVISMDLKGAPPAESHDGVITSIDGNIQIRVGADEPAIARAAEALLTKSQTDMVDLVKQVVASAVQESLFGVSLKEGGADMTAVRDKSKQITQDKLKELGLVINSFTLILQPAPAPKI